MMSGPVDDPVLTPRTRLLKDQTFRFEEAWKAALESGDPPAIDVFLGNADEPERSRLANEFQRIERTYRVLLSFHNAPTVASDPKSITTSDANPTLNEAAIEHAEGLEASNILIPIQATDDDQSCQPEPSVATLRLPDSFPPPSIGQNVLDHSASGSVQIPLLDSWGRDVEAPPIARKLGSVASPQPFVKGYEIIGELGRGGMGVVYKANQQGLNRLVAIKMVLGGDHAREEDLARFKVEAESVASIQHPNIVQIYEVGDKDGTPYFSLEYIDGGTLHQRVDGKPLPPEEAAVIAHQLAQAMEHFHERGVIHRDLKPANVLMTLNGSPKITDFGLAKRLEGNSSQTRTGSLMGTPSYMAPEQANGDTHAIGPLSDLYSLGAVLYEMLTGRPPFQGATMLDTLDQVRSQEPVPPRRLQPKIPRDLETICLKCLQKEPSKRYAGASELVIDLRRFLDGEPIRARPISRLELGWRWSRRNPRLAFLNVSIFLLALMLVVLAVVGTYRSARETQTINAARVIAQERLQRAKRAIETGDLQRAIEIVDVPDPFVERTSALAAIRDETQRLRRQVRALGEFRRLLELSRYYGFRKQLTRAKAFFRQAITLYDEIGAHRGRGEFGLPPMQERPLQLFKEDVFDGLLIASQFEYDDAPTDDPAKLKDAASRALRWLDRAEPLLPPTRVLYNRRQFFKKEIGDLAGSEADRVRAEAIPLNSPVDLFWNGYADRNRGDEAALNKEDAKAVEYYAQARNKFARFLQARPESFWGYVEWANCHYRVGEHYDAIVGYTECIQLRPDAPLAYHNRAQAHAMIQEFEEAIADESHAIEHDGEYVDAYLGRAAASQNLGKLSEAVVDLDDAIRLEPSKPELVFQRGVLNFNLKRFSAALADFDFSVKAFPKLGGPYQNRAKTRFVVGDFEGSLADWVRVASLFPKDFESRYYLGIIPMGQRKYDEALRALDDCLRLNSKYPLALLAKARILHWRGDDPAALAEVNRVVSRIDTAKWDPATKAGYLNDRVDLYRNLGRFDESEQDARRSIALYPAQVDAYLAMALLEKVRGKPLSEVEAWYERMEQANPTSPDAHLRMAEFFRDLGQWNRALAEVEKARSLSGDRGPTLAELVNAGIVAASGDFQSAKNDVEIILKRVGRPDGKMLYAASSALSLASGSASKAGDFVRAKELADRSSELLQATLNQGYHDINYQEQERMIVDPALEPIENRPEVRRLLSFLP